MFQEAKDYGFREPKLQDMGSDFRVNLYRKELDVDIYGVIAPNESAKIAESSGLNETDGTKVGTNGTKVGTDGTNGTNGTKVAMFDRVKEEEERLLSVIREDETITQKQMSEKTGMSLRRIKRMTVELQKAGKIVRTGNSRVGKWRVED